MKRSSRTIYEGRIITLDVEQVELPNGVEMEMEIVHHPGGAAVVALDDRQNICLLKQYRHVCNDWIWELPAGKIDNQEPPLKTAQRELQEEAGVKAKHWHSLGHMVSSPGVFSEVVHCYLASELQQGHSRHEAEEVIEIHWLPLQQAFEWAMDNTITDAKTIIGLCRAYARLGGMG